MSSDLSTRFELLFEYTELLLEMFFRITNFWLLVLGRSEKLLAT